MEKRPPSKAPAAAILLPRFGLRNIEDTIAVAANSFRIVGTGVLVQYWDPQKAEGFFHEFSGWLIFVVSLFMLYLLHRVLTLFRRSEEVPA